MLLDVLAIAVRVARDTFHSRSDDPREIEVDWAVTPDVDFDFRLVAVEAVERSPA